MAGIDTAELIRARCFEILKTIPGLATITPDSGPTFPSAWRNRGNLKGEKLPAAVFLDGGERIHPDTSTYGKAKPGMPHTLMTLTPQVFIEPEPDKVIGNPTVTAAMVAFRRQVLKLFLHDDELLSLLGDDGQIEYLGNDSDMQTGAPMKGELQFDFAITYVFDPDDFVDF